MKKGVATYDRGGYPPGLHQLRRGFYLQRITFFL